LTDRQYRAAVRLLTIFAHQLGDSANGWIVLGHPNEPALIRQAKHFIRAHLAEPLSPGAVADHVHLNADRFSRLFKKVTGVTVAEYVNRARVERVKQLLANPDTRVSEAALATGFRDIAHFNRSFRRYTGQSPRQYRAQLAGATPKSDK
jgi:AraC-like DNA-binding protein